jgi:histone-lysine N-methyltransferase SETMAR
MTLEAIAKMGWEVLPHPSYSPDLAPSDYHLFGFVKHQLCGRFETREPIQKAVCQCLRMAGMEFYRRGIFKSTERWEICVQKSGDYVEK